MDLGDGDVKVKVKVLSVDSVSGESTYVLSRGKQRVVFELQIKLQLEVEVHVGGELKQIVTGKLTLPELSNDDLDDAKLPGGSKIVCEQTEWKPFFEAASKGCWEGVKTVLNVLIEQAKQKWA